MPTISVIVPNYNHAPYLRQRLDSIFNQTYQDFEVIILDDCSTDNSKEIIEEYRNRPQVSHIIYNETNSGYPFKQWAKGFELAQGEYIWIAESDDWAETNFLEHLVSILQKDKSLTFAFCESYWEHPQKTIKGRTLKKDSIYNGFDFIRNEQIFYNRIVNASSALFRKKILSSINNDYQLFKGCGDYLFWSSLCEHGNVFFTKEILNHFRRPPANTSNRCLSTGITFVENFNIYKYFKKKRYISRFANYRIIERFLSEIEEHSEVLKKNHCYSECRTIWENERAATNSTSTLLSFWANQINRCDNLPFYAKIWHFMRLPNTNIREFLFNRTKHP